MILRFSIGIKRNCTKDVCNKCPSFWSNKMNVYAGHKLTLSSIQILPQRYYYTSVITMCINWLCLLRIWCLKCNRNYHTMNRCFQFTNTSPQKTQASMDQTSTHLSYVTIFCDVLVTHHFFCRSHCCEFQAYLTQSTQNDHDFCVSEQSQTRGKKMFAFFCFIYFSIWIHWFCWSVFHFISFSFAVLLGD